MEFKFDFNKEFFDFNNNNNNNKDNCDLSNSFINDIKNIKNIKNENDKNIVYKNYNETKNRYIKSENIFKTSKLIKFPNKITKSYIKINLNENIKNKNNFISLTLNTTSSSNNNKNNNNKNNNNNFNLKNKFYDLDLLKKKIDEKIYKKTGKIILDFIPKNKKYSRKSNSFSNYIKNNNNKSFIQPSIIFNKEKKPKLKSKKIINFYNLINNNNNI